MTDLFTLMQRFEDKFEGTVEDRKEYYTNINAHIQPHLDKWAASVPAAAKDVYRRRIERVMEYCLHRKFTTCHYNSRNVEVSLVYGSYTHPEMVIVLTDKYILSRDSEYSYREILFPRDWSTWKPFDRINAMMAKTAMAPKMSDTTMDYDPVTDVV